MTLYEFRNLRPGDVLEALGEYYLVTSEQLMSSDGKNSYKYVEIIYSRWSEDIGYHFRLYFDQSTTIEALIVVSGVHD